MHSCTAVNVSFSHQKVQFHFQVQKFEIWNVDIFWFFFRWVCLKCVCDDHTNFLICFVLWKVFMWRIFIAKLSKIVGKNVTRMWKKKFLCFVFIVIVIHHKKISNKPSKEKFEKCPHFKFQIFALRNALDFLDIKMKLVFHQMNAFHTHTHKIKFKKAH